MTKDASDEGFCAAKDGIAKQDCPYDSDSLQGSEWRQGWIGYSTALFADIFAIDSED